MVSSRVIVSDAANQPLKILKLLVESLGFKAEASLWLTPLTHAPQLMRPFPFDLVYLDKNLKVIQAAELLPEVPFPRYDERVRTALVLPLRAIGLTGTELDDQFVICAEGELEALVKEIRTRATAEVAGPPTAELRDRTIEDVPAPAVVPPGKPATPIAAASFPVSQLPQVPPLPFPSSPVTPVTVPIVAAAVSQGSGFTVAMTTTWQITNSTTATVLTEKAAAATEAAAQQGLSVAVLPDADARPPAAPAENVDAPELRLPDADRAVRTTPAPVAKSVQEEPLPVADVPTVTELESIVVRESIAAEEVEDRSPSARARPSDSAAAQQTEEAQRPTPDTPITSPPVAIKIETPAKAPETISVATDVEPETSNQGARRKKKDPLGALKRFLNAEDPLPERRTATRLLSPGLVAYDRNVHGGKPHEVGDVSPTGLFVRTKERWRRPGDLISLMLQTKNATEKEYQSRVVVEAEAVRSDAGGVGLAFVLPEGVEFRPWHRVNTKRSDETDGQYFVRELRTATARGFLGRICPPAGEEIRQLLYVRHSNKRVANAVAIALKAEELLRQSGNGGSMLAHPDLVVGILEGGSWAEDEWIQQRWAGLLATSCTADGQDKSNLVFVEMLDKLTPIHLRILYAACQKGVAVSSKDELTSNVTLYCTADELIEAAGTYSLPRIQQTIGHLANFGLLAENNRPSYIHATEKTKSKTTPTSLGMQMFARSSGRR